MPEADPGNDGGRMAFLDTNVLLYAFAKDDPRSLAAETLLLQGCCIGVQGLNEFANVARRKLQFAWPDVERALRAIRAVCASIVPLDVDIHKAGIAIAARYHLSIYDGLMLAAARRAGCRVFWSEDMQDGLVVEDALTILNPFAVR